VDEPEITTTRWATSGSTQWGPITGEMHELLDHFAPAAIERATGYGFDDRRESAWALLLAPMAPLFGLMFFGWSTGDALSVLLINLLIGLLDDVGKVLRAGASWAEIRHDAVRDAFVWRVAAALQAGRSRVHVTSLPRPVEFADGYPMDLFWLALAAAFGVSGFCLLMLNGPGTLHPSGVGIYTGVLPSLLLSIALAAFHLKHQHPHWRNAGSVRLRSTTSTASFVVLVAAYPFTLLGAEVVPQSESSMNAATVLPLVATLLWGGYKLLDLSAMRRVARWLASRAPPSTGAQANRANRAKIPR
jgi:hypothetical protein